MLQIGTLLTSKTNKNKVYRIKEIDSEKAILENIKDEETKELKLKTIERNYTYEEAVEIPAEEIEPESDIVSEPEIADQEEVEEEPADGVEVPEESADKVQEDTQPATLSVRETKELLLKEKLVAQIPLNFLAGKMLAVETVRQMSVDEIQDLLEEAGIHIPKRRGRSRSPFNNLDTTFYSKTVSHVVTDGDFFRTEEYKGKTASWSYSRTTKNNAFHRAVLIIEGEQLRLVSPSKAKVASILSDRFDATIELM